MKNNRGAAMIEFALVLPLLAILVFGIIEFGLIIYHKAMITNASREGARVGIVFRVDSNGDYISPDTSTVHTLIMDRIQQYLGYDIATNKYSYLIGFPQSTPVISIPPVIGTSPGGTLLVRVDYNYNFLVIPSFIKSIELTIPLSAVTTMRLE